jgi:vacuolar protein sorting-associated protein 54
MRLGCQSPHASVLPTPRVELPRVRWKDSSPCLSTIGAEWPSSIISCSAVLLLYSWKSQTSMAHPMLSILCVHLSYFRHSPPCPTLTLVNVTEVPSSSSPSSSYLPSCSASTSPATHYDRSTLAHSLPLLEKLSHHADTLEQHLICEIARRAMPFFAALSNLQDPQAESARCLAHVKSLRVQLTDVRENGARRGLHGVHREVRLAHLREVQAGVCMIRGVVETVGVVRVLVDGHEWGAALDSVDKLHAIWNGAQAVVLPPTPSPRSTPLPSITEEGPPGDDEAALQEVRRTGTVLNIPLSKLKAFAALPNQLQTLTQEITSLLTSDLVAVLKISLSERIHLGRHQMITRTRPMDCDLSSKASYGPGI